MVFGENNTKFHTKVLILVNSSMISLCYYIPIVMKFEENIIYIFKGKFVKFDCVIFNNNMNKPIVSLTNYTIYRPNPLGFDLFISNNNKKHEYIV